MENLAKLGIDLGGVIIYLANFGLLWLILAYMVFPKVIKMIDARRTQIEDNLQAAEAIQNKLDTTLVTVQAEKEELTGQIARERQTLLADLDQEKSQVLTAAEAQSEKLIEQARALIKEERGNLINIAQADMAKLIRKAVEHILAREVDEATVQQSLSLAWEEYRQEAKI